MSKKKKVKRLSIRPLNFARGGASKVMRSTVFRRNKIVRTYELDKWIRGWKHMLTMDKLILFKDLFTVDNSFFLVDARRADEFNYSHLKGAINMPSMVPSDEFMKHVHRDTVIVVYCTVGLRSGILTRRLRKLGFKNAMTLSGSMYKWVNEGRPLYREEERVYGVIPQHWFASLLLSPDKIRRSQVKTMRGPRLFRGVRRTYIGAKQAIKSTRRYRRIYRKRYKQHLREINHRKKYGTMNGSQNGDSHSSMIMRYKQPLPAQHGIIPPSGNYIAGHA